MSSAKVRRSSHSALIVSLAAGVLALLSYLASVGPVAVLVVRLDQPEYLDALQTFYAPLVWLDRHVPGAHGHLSWYVEFWAKLCGME